ncbi:MAG: response regulator [Candidatus Margulisiibacteriota bacterium]
MQGKRILLIDDNPAFIESFRQSCAYAGALVEIIEDGVHGLEAARNNNPDVVIIDTEVPRCNGWIVCRLLKYDKKYHTIPIVLVSPLGNEKALATEVGADAFVEKSVGADMVMQAARQLFNT